MTKNETPPSLKLEASASKDDLSDLMQQADDVIKREEEELADLSPADRAANLRTRAFVEKLDPEERFKFFSFIGNEEFFNTFEYYVSGDRDADKDEIKPPARTLALECNDSADGEEMPVNQGIRYRAMSDAEKHSSMRIISSLSAKKSLKRSTSLVQSLHFRINGVCRGTNI